MGMMTVLSSKEKMARGSWSNTLVSRTKFFFMGIHGVSRMARSNQWIVARPLQICGPMNSWKCTICGFVDGAEKAPAHCPECGSRDTMFVASDEAPHGI